MPEADEVINNVLPRYGQVRKSPKNESVYRMRMYDGVQLARARKRKAVARRRRRVIGDENWGEMAVRPRRQRRRTGMRRRRRNN